MTMTTTSATMPLKNCLKKKNQFYLLVLEVTIAMSLGSFILYNTYFEQEERLASETTSLLSDSEDELRIPIDASAHNDDGAVAVAVRDDDDPHRLPCVDGLLRAVVSRKQAYEKPVYDLLRLAIGEMMSLDNEKIASFSLKSIAREESFFIRNAETLKQKLHQARLNITGGCDPELPSRVAVCTIQRQQRSHRSHNQQQNLSHLFQPQQHSRSWRSVQEFLSHWLLLGVTKVIIYQESIDELEHQQTTSTSHSSSSTASLEAQWQYYEMLIEPFKQAGVVETIDWTSPSPSPSPSPQQQQQQQSSSSSPRHEEKSHHHHHNHQTREEEERVLEACIKRFRSEFDWIAFVEMDDFLVIHPPHTRCLNQLLRNNFTKHGALVVDRRFASPLGGGRDELVKDETVSQIDRRSITEATTMAGTPSSSSGKLMLERYKYQTHSSDSSHIRSIIVQPKLVLFEDDDLTPYNESSDSTATASPTSQPTLTNDTSPKSSSSPQQEHQHDHQRSSEPREYMGLRYLHGLHAVDFNEEIVYDTDHSVRHPSLGDKWRHVELRHFYGGGIDWMDYFYETLCSHQHSSSSSSSSRELELEFEDRVARANALLLSDESFDPETQHTERLRKFLYDRQ